MRRPSPVVLDVDVLCGVRKKIQNGNNSKLTADLATLIKQADEALQHGPWSVTSKETVGPSGDIHDYVSQAPYWWPSNTPDGLPYVRRDGERNPETLKFTDKTDRAKVFESSFILALAWFYTGAPKYATHAADILRTWFVAPATRMNPNLNNAQSIPGVNTGRAIGIIDFSQGYSSVLDAAGLLSDAPEWADEDVDGFHQWNVDYLDWLRSSDFGIGESRELNNHGTFAIMQKAAIALFVGSEAVVIEEVEAIKGCIDRIIKPDGSQPLELERTRSFHYSCFSLLAFVRMACISPRIGIDLWKYRGPQGQTLHDAVNFLIPAATGAMQWEHPEIEFISYAASDLIRAAADTDNCTAKDAVPLLQLPPSGDLWYLRPAPEQLDTVK